MLLASRFWDAHLSCVTLKDRIIFVSYVLYVILCVISDVLAVCVRAFVECGFCRTVHLSTPSLGVLNEMQFYDSYEFN